MTNKEAIELLNKALGCVQTDPRNCGKCKECKNYATKEDGIEAIRTAIAALEKTETNRPEIPDSWIPVKAHPATDEEQESSPDIDYWFDCEMPDDEQEILVTVKRKN